MLRKKYANVTQMLRNFITSICFAYSVLYYIERKSCSLSIFLQHFGRIFGRIFRCNYNNVNEMQYFFAGKSYMPIFFCHTACVALRRRKFILHRSVPQHYCYSFPEELRLVAHQPKRLNNAVVNPVDIYISSPQGRRIRNSTPHLASAPTLYCPIQPPFFLP